MKPTSSKSLFQHLLVGSLIIALGGCATFDREEMVLQDYRPSNSHPYSVSVSVGNNSTESVGGLVPIPNQDLQYAIEESIRKSQVFERLVSGKDGDYLLNVTVFTLEQPAMGFNMTVKLEAGWTLTKTGGDIVWQQVITSQYTLGVGDAFSGATRFRMCNDGAIRENIKKGMVKLSALSL